MHLHVPLLVGGHKHILLLKQLAQRAILVHRHEDIRATDKLAANVQLGNRLPVAVLLDACSSIVSKMSLSASITHSPWISHIPDLSSSSSSTLNAVNFCGLTPWRPRIWMAAREKPHCGVSGVPFMNSTTGAEATALSIAVRTSVDRKDFWRAAKRGERRGLRRGRRVWEATCGCVRSASAFGKTDMTDREGGSGEHAGGVHVVWFVGWRMLG
jgi:hypothetical protein